MKAKPVGDLKIEYVRVDELKPAEYNPRKISAEDMEKLKESIERFGMIDPAIVNKAPARKNIVIGGHQRLKAAVALGHALMPVVYVNIPDVAKEKELNLRLNRNQGEFDDKLLAAFDESLLKLVGFSAGELDKIFPSTEMEDDFDGDKAAAAIKKPRTNRGEVWELGDHRLMCGDSTNPDDLKILMGQAKADMVFTDPPYNVAIEGKQGTIMNDDMDDDKFAAFSEAFIARMHEGTKPGAPYYICSGYNSYPMFLWALKKNGFKFSSVIVWVKNSASLTFSDYQHKTEMIVKTKAPEAKKKGEPILYGWKNGAHYFESAKFESDVWEIKRRATNSMVHPTQKPLALVGRAIRNSSKRGGSVLDLFGGSGSTVIAAEKEGRRAFAMELDPKYCDVIVGRWEKFTGKKAKLLHE